MSFFQKLSMLIRSNLNDLIARAENPEKMLEQVIIDMREQLTKAKQEVAHAIADERKLKAQVESEAKQAQEWERRAMVALQQNREDLARQALMRQQEYAERAQSLHETWQRQASETEKVKDALRQLSSKIEEAQRKKNLLIAKQKRAQAQRRIHETMSGLSDSSAFEAFDRMAQRIEHSERQALAAAEVSDELSGDPLERQFKALEAGSGSADVEFRLMAMKEKMGMLPAGSSAETRRLSGGQEAPVQDAELVDDHEEEAPGAPGQPAAGAAPEGGRMRDKQLEDEFAELEKQDRGTG